MPQQGRLTLKLDSADGQPLDFKAHNKADKLLEYIVTFPKPFAFPPLVHLGTVGITSQTSGATNWKPDLAFELLADEITTEQFKLRIRLSWFNTATAVTASWLAIETATAEHNTP